MKTKRIAVVMGGCSSEREVSLKTGRSVTAALRSLGYDAQALDWTPGASLPALLESQRIEVVWNALHGTYGEDGAVQGLLSCMGILCTGSGILASALAMDKIASKRVFESQEIPTPRWQVWQDNSELAFEYPVVVKPANEGSSVGVSIATTSEELQLSVELASSHHGPTLIEEYIVGREIFVGILGENVLGTIEVRPAEGFYDYDAKYERNDTEYLIPAPIEAVMSERLHTLALQAHRALGCTGYSRVDARVRATGEAFVLEVNTLPGMTDSSLVPKLAVYAGMSYSEICEEILRMAC